jgi:hypothetical protein
MEANAERVKALVAASGVGPDDIMVLQGTGAKGTGTNLVTMALGLGEFSATAVVSTPARHAERLRSDGVDRG